MFVGLALGLFFNQVAVGVLLGLGAGFLSVSLLRQRLGPAETRAESNAERARELAEIRYWFRWHVVIYVIVNIGLAFLWYLLGGGFPWPLFPIIFWPVGLAAHYWVAYRSGDGWIERETEKIMGEQDEK